MSEKFTAIQTVHGGLGEWGHVPPADAIAIMRRFYEGQLKQAQTVLAEIAAGDVEVFHQRGVPVATNRRQVWPVPS